MYAYLFRGWRASAAEVGYYLRKREQTILKLFFLIDSWSIISFKPNRPYIQFLIMSIVKVVPNPTISRTISPLSSENDVFFSDDTGMDSARLGKGWCEITGQKGSQMRFIVQVLTVRPQEGARGVEKLAVWKNFSHLQ